jgi:prevent-host-death family protein
MSIASIRPSADLRNHYKEISQLVRETRRPVIITLNGREDTAVLGFQDYQQMVAELELLRTLAEAEEDAAAGRVAPLADTLQALRKALPKEPSK